MHRSDFIEQQRPAVRSVCPAFGIDCRRLGPAVDVKFVINVGEIIFDRLIAEPQRSGDFLVGLSLHDKRENPLFLGREPMLGGVMGLHHPVGLDPAQGLPSNSLVEVSLPCRHRSNGANEIIRPDIFQGVPVSAMSDGRDDRGLFGIAAQDEDLRLGCALQNFPAGFDPGHVGQFDIEQDDVRAAPARNADRFRGGPAIPHDAYPGDKTDHGAQPGPHHFVVVHNEHADVFASH